jgi:uncharacterized protein with GYD domain
MNTYIALVNYTDLGIKTVNESPTRAAAIGEKLAAAGGRVKEVYLTMGNYDFVVIFEAPDDETMARVLLEAGKLGTVRTTTMRAFPKDAFESIVASL